MAQKYQITFRVFKKYCRGMLRHMTDACVLDGPMKFECHEKNCPLLKRLKKV